MHFIGKPRRERHERDEVRVAPHHSDALGLLVRDDVAVDTRASLVVKPRRLLELASWPRWHVREAVDLPVRVVERHADYLALVLENEHVADIGTRAERRVTVGPHVHQPSDA